MSSEQTSDSAETLRNPKEKDVRSYINQRIAEDITNARMDVLEAKDWAANERKEDKSRRMVYEAVCDYALVCYSLFMKSAEGKKLWFGNDKEPLKIITHPKHHDDDYPKYDIRNGKIIWGIQDYVNLPTPIEFTWIKESRDGWNQKQTEKKTSEIYTSIDTSMYVYQKITHYVTVNCGLDIEIDDGKEEPGFLEL